MIKAAGSRNGNPLLILGLSQSNLDRLPQDMPIRITAADMVLMGLPAIEVVIMGGATEEAIAEQLQSLPGPPRG